MTFVTIILQLFAVHLKLELLSVLPLIIVHFAKTCKSTAKAKHNVSNIKQAIEIIDSNMFRIKDKY